MTKELFIKYLQGNCSEKEFEEIISWIGVESQSISGKGIVQEIWEEFEPESDSADKTKYNRLLDKIHHQININQNPNQFIIRKAPAKGRILSILTRAAAILLLPVLGFLLYTQLFHTTRFANNINDIEVIAPASSRIQISLGDGTKVWLNQGGKLKYPTRFTGKERKVFLTGEAYFEVAHNKKVPFIVGTSHMDVKATGTAFNVSAYPEDNTVSTTLIEGKVILYENSTNSEIKALEPGECLTLNIQKNVFNVQTGNTDKYTAWKDGMLVFRNDRIEEVAKKLGRWYNIDVEINKARIKDYPFTATFTDETLPQVLDLLSLATPISYTLIKSKKLADGSFSKQKVLIRLK